MTRKILLTGFGDEIDPSFARQLEALDEFGIRHIELRTADGINIADFSDAKLSEVKRRLEAHKIKVSSLGSPIGKIKITDDFAAHFEIFKRLAASAKELETPYIRVFSFYIPPDEPAKAYREAVLSRLARMIDYAAKHNLILLHENEKGIYGNTAQRCEDLLRSFESAHFRAVFDPANFLECGENTYQAYERLKPYIAYLHIKDFSVCRNEVVPAGEGDGQIAAILHHLKQAGFEGFLSLEPHLVNFTGLQRLEKNPKQRPDPANGKIAWHTALNALKAILWDIDWR